MGAFKFTLDGRRIASARIAYGGMAGDAEAREPRRRRRLPARLSTSPPSGRRRSRRLRGTFTPLDDHRASAAYRALVARNLLFKALSEIASGETRATRIVGLPRDAAGGGVGRWTRGEERRADPSPLAGEGRGSRSGLGLGLGRAVDAEINSR